MNMWMKLILDNVVVHMYLSTYRVISLIKFKLKIKCLIYVITIDAFSTSVRLFDNYN